MSLSGLPCDQKCLTIRMGAGLVEVVHAVGLRTVSKKIISVIRGVVC